MGVMQPREISETFARLFNARDRRGLLDLYAVDAVLTIDGVNFARGHPQIASILAQVLDGPLKIVSRCSLCHEVADTALVRTDWRLMAPDGSLAMAGASAEVLRRGFDDRWRFVVDDATFASRPPSA